MQSNNAYLNFMIILNVLLEIKHSNADGYSFAKFIGPVSGAEQKIHTAKKHENNLNTNLNHGYGYGYGSVDSADFFAKPDYHFAYGVEDSKTGVLQNHKETRNGDKVKGEYRVVDPDGSLRVVKYSADNNKGFQAEVIHDGKTLVHGRDEAQNDDPAYHDDDDDEEVDDAENNDDEEYTEEDARDNDGEDGENDNDIEYEHKSNEGDEEYFHFDFEDDFY